MKQKVYTKRYNTLSAFLFGHIIGLMFFGLFTSLFALFLTKKDLNVLTIRCVFLVLVFMSTFAASIYPVKHTKIKGIFVGLICGLFIPLLFLSILFIINSFSVDALAFAILPIGITGGVLGGILASNIR